MLDKADTATKLKKNLEKAFSKWRERDPTTNTKATLARRCAELSGRNCSPQTVSSWFATGRMDKIWLPVLEDILGSSLGFGGLSVQPIESHATDGASNWPFEMIDFRKLISLGRDDLLRLEGSILQAAGQLRIDIEAPQTRKRHAA